MVIGIFTDDFYPYIGGIGRHIFEIANRLPQEQGFVCSPCENRIINHAKVKAPFYTMLKNLGLSLWLHQNLNRLIIKNKLTTTHIHCFPGGLFFVKKPRVPVIPKCHCFYENSRQSCKEEEKNGSATNHQIVLRRAVYVAWNESFSAIAQYFSGFS